MAESFLEPGRYPHGTRARYVADKCRCKRCKGANTAYYRDRHRRALAAAPEVTPSRRRGAQWTAFMRTRPDGTSYSVTAPMCPGANGKGCVQGGAWLKGRRKVCAACIERATVWNGLVSARRARKHILELRARHIGRHTVAAACDVAATVIGDVASGKQKKLRAHTERRILSVDEGARADYSYVPSARTYELLNDLLARGFTGRWISRQLGHVNTYASVLQCQTRDFVIARNAAEFEKLHRRIVEQGIEPPPKWGRIAGADTYKKIDRLLSEGFKLKPLSRRLGINLRAPAKRGPNVQRTTAEKVAQFFRTVMAGEGDDDVADLVEPAEDEGKRRRLISAYLDGVTMEDLEARFDLEARQIYRLLAAAGVKRRGEGDADAA